LVGGCNDLEEFVALIFKVKVKMETEGSFEIFITTYQFAWCHNPEDINMITEYCILTARIAQSL
jgi:hypothetical protein